MKVEFYINDNDMLKVKNKLICAFPNLTSIVFDCKKQDENRWRSVEEELPEECLLVWVCDERNHVCSAFRLGENYCYSNGDLIESLERVVLWQPIVAPAPPKEEE